MYIVPSLICYNIAFTFMFIITACFISEIITFLGAGLTYDCLLVESVCTIYPVAIYVLTSTTAEERAFVALCMSCNIAYTCNPITTQSIHSLRGLNIVWSLLDCGLYVELACKCLPHCLLGVLHRCDFRNQGDAAAVRRPEVPCGSGPHLCHSEM